MASRRWGEGGAYLTVLGPPGHGAATSRSREQSAAQPSDAFPTPTVLAGFTEPTSVAFRWGEWPPDDIRGPGSAGMRGPALQHSHPFHPHHSPASLPSHSGSSTAASNSWNFPRCSFSWSPPLHGTSIPLAAHPEITPVPC